jgi:uncharacterized membrane protein
MAGYVIAVVAFVLPFVLGVAGLGRPRIVLATAAVLAFGWIISLAAARPADERGDALVPLWAVAGLVGLLYGIWCGGLWLGLRLRRIRQTARG